MTDKQRKIDGFNRLRELLKPGDTVFTKLCSVSRSGMFRRMDVFVFRNNEPVWLTGSVAPVIEARYTMKDWQNSAGLGVSGCGMVMGFSVVHELSYALFKDGFECIGEKCPSNDHSNGDRDYTPHHHSSGGYALRHKWL